MPRRRWSGPLAPRAMLIVLVIASPRPAAAQGLDYIKSNYTNVLSAHHAGKILEFPSVP